MVTYNLLTITLSVSEEQASRPREVMARGAGSLRVGALPVP